MTDNKQLLAETISGMTSDEISDILQKLDDDAYKALRELIHPISGEKLKAKGMQVARPPRHETGSLVDDK